MNATVFHQAVADGDATRVKFLINIGQQARVNQINKQGYTALQQSCKDGRIDVVHVLLNHGANTSSTGRKDRTALHLAAAGGYADIVELLIASCADLSVQDKEGKRPVDVAKTDEIAKLLSTAEAEKKAKSSEANKKSNSEEWSQSFKSLPAGWRNSLVSNSSSDSGVYTEDFTCSRNLESKLASMNTRNGVGLGNRGCDSRAMGVLNEGEEVHNRSWFNAQTSVKPQPKLRRSMSERLPVRQRKRSSGGHRDISDELAALNLSRANSRRRHTTAADTSTSQYYYDLEREPKDGYDTTNEYTAIDSPNDDLGYCADDLEYGSTSVRKCFRSNPRSVTRNERDTLVCYVEDEGWHEEEEEEEDLVGDEQSIIQSRPIKGDRSGWDEMDAYRKSKPRNLRTARRRTVDVCESSHERDRHLAAPGNSQEYSNNDRLWSGERNRSQRPNSAMARASGPIAYEIDTYLDNNRNNILMRNSSACSDTAIGKYYQRRQQMSDLNEDHYERHFDYNDGYCDSKNGFRNNNNLPGYEETLRRFANERARHPASRQISQV